MCLLCITGAHRALRLGAPYDAWMLLSSSLSMSIHKPQADKHQWHNRICPRLFLHCVLGSLLDLFLLFITIDLSFPASLLFGLLFLFLCLWNCLFSSSEALEQDVSNLYPVTSLTLHPSSSPQPLFLRYLTL